MKMDVWCDGMDTLKDIKTVFTDEKGQNTLNIKSKRVHGNFLLITAEGVDSIESAMKYKGKELFAKRSDIPKNDGSFFIADLVGLAVYNAENGEEIGKVKDVFNRGASDILEIAQNGKSAALVPMVKDFIAEIDIEKGIYINVAEGLLD